jgi:hypothetical protein
VGIFEFQSLEKDWAKIVPDKISSFVSRQAAWRFFQNESGNLSKLHEPRNKAFSNITDSDTLTNIHFFLTFHCIG